MPEYCDISELLTNPYNRDIDRKKVEAIKQAIAESNEIRPLVYAEVDHDGKPAKMITDGHHRYHALKELGYKEVPIVMQDERGIDTKAPNAEVEKTMTPEEVARHAANVRWGNAEARGEETPAPKATKPKQSKEQAAVTVRNAAIATAIGVSAVALANPVSRRFLREAVERVSQAKAGRGFVTGAQAKSAFGVTGKPNPSIITSAKAYTQKSGLPEFKVTKPVAVDREQAARMADAYDAMKSNPNDPRVKEAYQAFAREIDEQYKQLPVKPQFTSSDPYKTSEELMKDLKENKSFKVFTGGEPHPFLNQKDRNGISTNDKFRAIHDYYGHAGNGFGFSHAGEENAWAEHSKMFSPLAQRALTTETRGQTAWFRMSKENVGKAIKDRKFPEQKVGLLPEEFWPEAARTGAKSVEKISKEHANMIGEAFASTAAGGITMSLGGNKPSDGYAVSPYKHREQVVDSKEFNKKTVEQYIYNNQDALATPKHYYGGWKNDQDGKVYLDVSIVSKNETDAKKLAIDNNQEGYYDIRNGKTVYVERSKKDAVSNQDKQAILTKVQDIAKAYQNRKEYNPRTKNPDSSFAQANDESSELRMETIYQDLIGMGSSLQQLEETAIQQGLLTEEELAAIIVPLKYQIESLLCALESGEDFREGQDEEQLEAPVEGEEEEEEINDEEPAEEETEEAEDTEASEEKPEASEEKEPKEKPPVEEKEEKEEKPVTDKKKKAPFKKSEEPQDLTKGPFGGIGGGRGFHGDSERHAEAARERWRMEGVPPGGRERQRVGRQRRGVAQRDDQQRQTGAADAALVIPKAVKNVAVQTAQKAGRAFAKTAGEAAADLGVQALGTVAGIILYRYLSGQSTGVRDLARMGKAGLKDALKRSFQLRRIDSLARKNKMATLVRNWAHKP